MSVRSSGMVVNHVVLMDEIGEDDVSDGIWVMRWMGRKDREGVDVSLMMTTSLCLLTSA